MDVSKEIKKDFACDVVEKFVPKKKGKKLLTEDVLTPR